MGATLEVETKDRAGRRTLILRGELDLSNATQFADALRAACSSGAHELAVDLSGLDFMDSTGLRALLDGGRICAGHDCNYVVEPTMTTQVRRLFELAGVDDHVVFARDVGAAETELGGPAAG